MDALEKLIGAGPTTLLAAAILVFVWVAGQVVLWWLKQRSEKAALEKSIESRTAEHQQNLASRKESTRALTDAFTGALNAHHDKVLLAQEDMLKRLTQSQELLVAKFADDRKQLALALTEAMPDCAFEGDAAKKFDRLHDAHLVDPQARRPKDQSLKMHASTDAEEAAIASRGLLEKVVEGVGDIKRGLEGVRDAVLEGPRPARKARS